DFSVNPGPTSCLDGGCTGGLKCADGTGVPPATLAEFSLGTDDGFDYYDGLRKAKCLADTPFRSLSCGWVQLANSCRPSALKGPFDYSEPPQAVGCKSACQAQLPAGADPNNSPNCCTGSYNTPHTWPSSGVQYYDYFKSKCANSLAYAYDESSGTALWNCDSSAKSDYIVQFCPSS
ncbi:thaumatin, partial [Russula dissimulans]